MCIQKSFYTDPVIEFDMPVNQIILQKIEDSGYSSEIKDILKIILDYEDTRASTGEIRFAQQYDKIITTCLGI